MTTKAERNALLAQIILILPTVIMEIFITAIKLVVIQTLILLKTDGVAKIVMTTHISVQLLALIVNPKYLAQLIYVIRLLKSCKSMALA